VQSKKRVLLALIVVLCAVGSGLAWAAWNTSGSGTGYAKAASASDLVLADASAATSADLYPGAQGAVKVKVTNPNSFPVRITAVTQGGAITSNAGAACNASTGVTFTDQTGLSLELDAGETDTFSLSNAAAMSNASANACQGAVFSIPVTVTGVSNAS
jgi:hypothetical protein